MRIYIDFDDVICETAKHFCCIAKELFDIDLPYREVQFFNLKKSFNLDDAQYEELMKAGHLPGTLLSYEETPGASEIINKWVDEGHEVSIITGRPFDSYEPSRRWLDEHHLDRVPLYCVDKYGREQFTTDFSFSMTLEQLYEMTFDLAIEDSPAAFEHVLHFDNCRVAIFNRPWNLKAELPNENFVRCEDWKEIDRVFRESGLTLRLRSHAGNIDSMPSQKSMSLKEYLETTGEKWFLTGKKKYTVQAMMVSKEMTFHNDLEVVDPVAADDGETVVLKGTRDEIWTSPLPKVISRYTKPDGSELCREDFANKDVYFDIVTIPAKDAYYAMHIPNDITITVETAQGDVLHANLPNAPHGEGDYLVCTMREDGGPNLSDIWILNGLIFIDCYDTSNMDKQ